MTANVVAPWPYVVITTVGPHSELYYTITVTNHGPDRATNVTLIDELWTGDGSRFGGVELITQGSCEDTTTYPYTTDSVTCALGELAPNASAVVSLRFLIFYPPVEHRASLFYGVHNTATVSATESDPDPWNNRHNADTTAVWPLAPACYLFPESCD